MKRNLKEMTGIRWLIKDLHALHNGMSITTKYLKETLELMDAEPLWENLEFYKKLMTYVDKLEEIQNLHLEINQFANEERLRQLRAKIHLAPPPE